MKYIVGVVILIVVLAGGYYLLMGNNTGGLMPQGNTGSTGQMQEATSTYATSTFSIVYPSDYTVNDAYTNTEVSPKKPISGVSFTIPGTMATGTNLSTDTHIAVEWLPRAKQCTADIYLAANVKPQNITDTNGVQYSVATSSDAAAGNRYDETVYALTGSSPCTAVRYYVHYSAIENYPPGMVQPFDQAALTSAFDTIRQSLVLTH